MFERVTIHESETNPKRDIITDEQSGLTMEVVQMARELFVPLVHMEPHEAGFFIGFTDNPRNRYEGIYFILDLQPEDSLPPLQDVLAAAYGYCRFRNLPEPASVVRVSKMG